MEKWENLRILILGKTYPHYAGKYGETACTGGIREDTFEMIRLYPIPERYLDKSQHFSAFQWIEVRARRDNQDPRPQSYRIDLTSLRPAEKIPKQRARRTIVEQCINRFDSISQLRENQKTKGTSLGIISPTSIISFNLRLRPMRERTTWTQKKKQIFDQELLFDTHPKPIDFPEMKFQVSWTCADSPCTGHRMNLLQWGIHELYRKYQGDPQRNDRVLEALSRRLDLEKNDIFFFLGNFRGHLTTFGLMDVLTVPKEGDQLTLFS